MVHEKQIQTDPRSGHGPEVSVQVALSTSGGRPGMRALRNPQVDNRDIEREAVQSLRCVWVIPKEVEGRWPWATQVPLE